MDIIKDTIKDITMNKYTNITNTEQTLSAEQITNNSLIKDAQKILKAFYVITDLFPHEEPLIQSIRNSALETTKALFTYVRRLDTMSLKNAQYYLYELISFSDVARSVGLISEMNYNILKGEVEKMERDIHIELSKEKASVKDQFLTNLFREETIVNKIETSFNFPQEKGEAEKVSKNEALSIKKTHSYQNKMSYKKNIQKSDQKISLKDKRHKNILGILKQKKNASITDVCTLFKDCSSKTIQRDLKELIQKKKVTKKGERRWAVYNLL